MRPRGNCLGPSSSSGCREDGLPVVPKGAKVGRLTGRGVRETGLGLGVDDGEGEGKSEKETGWGLRVEDTNGFSKVSEGGSENSSAETG